MLTTDEPGAPATAYLAGDYARKEEIGAYEADLLKAGWGSTARWLRQPDLAGEGAGNPGLGAGGLDGDEFAEFARQFSAQDLDDVARADVLVAFTTGKKTRGGRHTETGAALALRKPVLLVGPAETVFHWHPAVRRVADWQAAQAVLRVVRNSPVIWREWLVRAWTPPSWLYADAALIASRLDTLADWWDRYDAGRGAAGEDEVQRDLRGWAQRLRAGGRLP